MRDLLDEKAIARVVNPSQLSILIVRLSEPGNQMYGRSLERFVA
ncbi:hypothetical protein [Coleofasciculus sp. G2-EDA-02]